MIIDSEVYHHGVKGMKWGVRKDDSVGGRSSSSSDDAKKKKRPSEDESSVRGTSAVGASAKKKQTEEDRLKAEYQAIPDPTYTKKQQAENLAIAEKKALAKFGPAGGKPENPNLGGGPRGEKGWRPTKKQLMVAGVGAAAVAYLLYKQKTGGKAPLGFMTDRDIDAADVGARLSPDEFRSRVQNSKQKSWATGRFLNRDSYDQPEIRLPAGHVFNRLSTHPETAGRPGFGTYATASTADFNRYVAGFRNELGGSQLHHVTFSSTSEVRIPTLVQRLEAMRESMGPGTSKGAAKRAYLRETGGPWSSERSQSFFDTLKAKGFGAIIDDMDAGVIGERPMVLFGDMFTDRVATPMSSSMISAAENAVTEIANRIR